jgi:uncharacterized membrane protein YfcA
LETPPVLSAALLGLAGTAIGLAIGSTGIGGVLLVPFLAYVVGLPVPSAIADALWSYLWSGIVAAVLYGRRGSIAWRMAAWLCGAAVPGAFLGAEAVPLVPAGVLEGLIAALLLAAGANALRPARDLSPGRRLSRGALVGLGAFTGFGSALVGGGGAFILVPLLAALGQPLLLSVGLAQAIQIPISAVATLANVSAGRVDFAFASLIAATLALGTALGVPLAHALPQRALRRLLAVTMLLAGAAIVARLALSAA